MTAIGLVPVVGFGISLNGSFLETRLRTLCHEQAFK
jgi:hypothetical protein